ncbi:helix-turn-helix domain-containing protein [Lederbergia citrea]|uniref:Phosphotransferase n=1 Tax=Lederbergia citrea TaxID=2833581 RepID=A0A942UHX0_9BACI|nr:phosphotransferase [Lederbergia citrea]MBS4177002.1 phosphotransferase [Lederbergia citrea]MBS4203575.1 phosphotransferase [Lederbergia citrea]MBS4221770.1 phosphotransferase [Lederbergia citrea]
MNIGEKLKLRRKKTGFTQEQVAEKMHITRQTLSNWEVGKYFPDIDSIITLSQIYNLSLDELLLGKIYFKGESVMTKKLSFKETMSLLKTHYPDAINVKELNGGLVSQTYLFEVKEQRFIFQVGNNLESYKKQSFIDRKFNGILPVREVLEVHQTDDGVAYSISKYIEGDKLFDLNSQQLLDIVPAVLNTLETLESIDVLDDKQGYGYFDSTGNASFPTWLDFVEGVYNNDIYNWDSLEEKGLDSEVVEKAIKELKTHVKSINFSSKNIIHGDLGSFNLLAKDNLITGIIDWTLAMYGDHLYDKANFLFWNEEKLQPLIKEITTKHITNNETKEKIYCYMLRIGLEEIYNTVIRNEVGYDIEWVANRLNKIMDDFL